MENRSRLPIFILIGVLVILLMIPISAILINPMESDPLNTPIFELGDMSLNEMFGTHQLDTEFNVLNDNTLNDIFSTSNEIKYNQWLPYNSTLSYPTNNVRSTFLGTSSLGGIYKTITYNSNDVIYMRIDNFQTNAIDVQFQFRLDVLAPYKTLINGDDYSLLYFSTSNQNAVYYRLQKSTGNLLITDYMQVDNTFYINLTSLGIDDLTVDEMDMLYDYYTTGYYTFDTDLYMFLYAGLSLTADQWQYYYNLYTYYSSL